MIGFTLRLANYPANTAKWAGFFFLPAGIEYASGFLPVSEAWNEASLAGKATGTVLVSVYTETYGWIGSKVISNVTLESGKSYIVDYSTSQVKESGLGISLPPWMLILLVIAVILYGRQKR